MPKTNLCENKKEKKINFIVGMIEGGLSMNSVSKKELSKKTKMPLRTIYKRFEDPSSIRLDELIEFCDRAGVVISVDFKEKL